MEKSSTAAAVEANPVPIAIKSLNVLFISVPFLALPVY
jgi:hypothetical protein